MAKRPTTKSPGARSSGARSSVTKKRGKQRNAEDAAVAVDLRIIGGRLRGSRLEYGAHQSADGRVTRPMKHRVREAIFNLVGTEMAGKLAMDLFAGTGAIGLEALSRGAEAGLFIEKHVPSSTVVQNNIAALGVADACELRITSAFLWGKRDLPVVDKSRPWAVFVSPPYAFFADRLDEMLSLIGPVCEAAPAGSLVVVEADERFNFDLLPGGICAERHAIGWDVREYPPAVIGVWRTE